MNEIPEKVWRNWHECPVQETEEYEYVVNPMTDYSPPPEPELLQDSARYLLSLVEDSLEDATLLLSEEDRGGMLATTAAQMTGKRFTLAQWFPAGLEGEVELPFSNGYKEGSMYVNGISSDDRVIVIDDLVSTGGTMVSLIEAVRSTGAEVVDAAVLCQKPDFGGVEKVREETGVDVKCGFDIVIEDGRSKVLLPE